MITITNGFCNLMKKIILEFDCEWSARQKLIPRFYDAQLNNSEWNRDTNKRPSMYRCKAITCMDRIEIVQFQLK